MASSSHSSIIGILICISIVGNLLQIPLVGLNEEGGREVVNVLNDELDTFIRQQGREGRKWNCPDFHKKITGEHIFISTPGIMRRRRWK